MYRASLCFFAIFLTSACSNDSAAPADIGAGCESDEDCLEGLECLEELPQGMCSQPCDDDCPNDTLCVDLSGAGYCFAQCETNDDCRDGYACSLGYCDLPCSADEECPEQALCDNATGGCALRQDQPAGSACVSDDQCTSGHCFLTEDGGFCRENCGGHPLCEELDLPCGMLWLGSQPAASCRPAAGPVQVGGLCSSGLDCASGVCARGTCVYPCSQSGSCEGGASCEDLRANIEGHDYSIDVCLPEAAPGVIVDDRGPTSTDAGCIHLEWDVPEDIVAFAVILWTEEEALLDPHNLEGPDHQVLLNDRGIGPIRLYEDDRSVTILVPNTDDAEAAPHPGRYELDVCAWDIEAYRLLDAEINSRILFKVREGGRCDDGLLHLNIHLAPGVYGPMIAANAHESPYIQDILERLRHFYENQCNVTIGEISFFDMSSSYGVIGSETELGDMFESVTQHSPLASVNVFIVRDLSGVAEWVAGIAGGIPGPPYLRGTPHSGVAIATQEDGRTAGDTLSHELGHFLGLFHPTELNGMTQDVISDTPTCTFDPEDYYEIMHCATIDNIMFPSLTPYMDEITEGQCFVVRGNPAL